MPSIQELGFGVQLNTLEQMGFDNSHRRELIVDRELNDPQQMIPDLGLEGAKVTAMNVNRLVTGTIASKQVTLAVTPTEGDVYFAAGKSDFTNTDTGFILGIDDSDSDRAKFYIGNNTQYLNWTGTALNIAGVITASSINIPDTTTSNSFHVDSDGNTWWGANISDGYANSTAYVLKDGSAKFSNVTINNSTLTFQNVYGNGADGTVTISGNTTLTRDMFYDDLTVNNGITLSTASFRVFVKGTLTNNGTIENNGNDGVLGAAGIAVASGSLPAGLGGINGTAGGSGGGIGTPDVGDNGTTGNNSVKRLGVAGAAGAAGGTGGNGSSTSGAVGGTGGAAGTNTGTVFNKPNNIYSAYYLMDFLPATTMFSITTGSGTGAGGGQGGDDGSGEGGAGGTGGGSGSTGGMVWIAAKVIVNNGTISSNGGDGGDGGGGAAASAGNRGGGGGGGGAAAASGGVIFLIYSTYTDNGTVQATGGTGGTGGVGGAGFGTGTTGATGSTGSNGTAGTIYQIQI